VLAWLVLPAFLLDVAVRRLANWLAFSIAVELVVLFVLLAGVQQYTSIWGIIGAILIAEAIGWAIRFRHIGPAFDWMTHSVTALSQAGQRSAVALEQLKSAQEKVRGDLQTDEAAREKALHEPIAPLPKQTARRRFDAGDAARREPAGDLQESLGGARAAAASSKSEGEGATKSEETDATTSRLLAAKRRKKKDDQS
jgi:hypothetical protein